MKEYVGGDVDLRAIVGEKLAARDLDGDSFIEPDSETADDAAFDRAIDELELLWQEVINELKDPNLLCRSRLKWAKVGAEGPIQGREIDNTDLARELALQTRL